MQDIPEKLWHVRRELNGASLALKAEQGTMQVREADIALMIDGKNAEERKARLTLALRTDQGICTSQVEIDDLNRMIADLEAEEAYLTDLRRAAEWDIRLKIAAALSGRGIASDGGDGDMQEALDSAPIDRALFNRPVTVSVDEVPF